jgi:hypothetical protein
MSNWKNWEKALKIIAVIIILGIGLVEFIEFAYIQESLVFDAQEFSYWVTPLATVLGSIAVFFTVFFNIQHLMRGKSEKNYVYYEKKIRILDQNMHGYENTDLIDFASFINTKYNEIKDKWNDEDALNEIINNLEHYRLAALVLYSKYKILISAIYHSKKKLLKEDRNILLDNIINDKLRQYFTACNILRRNYDNKFSLIDKLYKRFYGHHDFLNQDEFFNIDFFELYGTIQNTNELRNIKERGILIDEK